ncbi:hypothetical protein L484_018065 [Morus notabilis]|uniref:Uncharacterized protein n=1 Tax=Morus notabilis TaxID=981085 RepID=W9R5R2_9ROSA|nr:hypothetical protein L484_018065 [Morus notabilis]
MGFFRFWVSPNLHAYPTPFSSLVVLLEIKMVRISSGMFAGSAWVRFEPEIMWLASRNATAETAVAAEATEKSPSSFLGQGVSAKKHSVMPSFWLGWTGCFDTAPGFEDLGIVMLGF